jgi:molybdopterin-guanine dinucleotide biosynthesis protein A
MAAGLAATQPFAGAVLTGGRSRRMGRDKALLVVSGRPMAARATDALREAGAEPVMAIGGDAAALEAAGIDVVPDRYPGEGPLGGLLTAFDALARHELVAVIATDLPDVAPAVLAQLVGDLGDDDAVFAAAEGDDRLEPLCGVWRIPSCRPVVEQAFADGERAVHRAVALVRHHTVAVRAPFLRNVNEPDDLAR